MMWRRRTSGFRHCMCQLSMYNPIIRSCLRATAALYPWKVVSPRTRAGGRGKRYQPVALSRHGQMERKGTRGNWKESDEVVCGGVVQLVRTPACHAGGRGFESRRSRQFFESAPHMFVKTSETKLLRVFLIYRA
jgi:hypothetical protein